MLALVACGSVARSVRQPLPPGTTLSLAVTTDLPMYDSARPIGVTVRNASSATYYVRDRQSECTIVQLQMLVHSTWQTVMPCGSGDPVHTRVITPHLTEPFTLAPGNAPGDPNLWTTGVYRILITASTSADGSGHSIIIYSAGFQIAA
jgi:hypothetical protein